MEKDDVYDLCGFIAIRETLAPREDLEKQEARMEMCKQGVIELFRRMKELPTKYDLHGPGKTYVIPERPRAHMREYSEEVVFPRSRELPKEKPKTRWQSFAEAKGIKKNRNKRGGRIYNEETEKYAPSYGRGSKNDVDRNWLIELKEGEDLSVDRHALLKKEKKKRVKKNEHNRRLNLKNTKLK